MNDWLFDVVWGGASCLTEAFFQVNRAIGRMVLTGEFGGRLRAPSLNHLLSLAGGLEHEFYFPFHMGCHPSH